MITQTRPELTPRSIARLLYEFLDSKHDSIEGLLESIKFMLLLYSFQGEDLSQVVSALLRNSSHVMSTIGDTIRLLKPAVASIREIETTVIDWFNVNLQVLIFVFRF